MELIDKKALLDEFLHMPELVYTNVIASTIEKIPAIDPVTRGSWIKTDLYTYPYRCTVCGKHTEIKSKFCPHCGSRNL